MCRARATGRGGRGGSLVGTKVTPVFYEYQKGAAPFPLPHGQQTTETEWKELCHSPHAVLEESLVKQFNGDGVSQLFVLTARIPHQGMLSKQFLTPHIIRAQEPAGWVILFGFISLWGDVFLYINYLFDKQIREPVVFTAAHHRRVKSQCSDLEARVLAPSQSWPRLFVLTHLPLGSPNGFLEYA